MSMVRMIVAPEKLGDFFSDLHRSYAQRGYDLGTYPRIPKIKVSRHGGDQHATGDYLIEMPEKAFDRLVALVTRVSIHSLYV